MTRVCVSDAAALLDRMQSYVPPAKEKCLDRASI